MAQQKICLQALQQGKLQRYLENLYGDSVVIQSQQGQGKSNMIMSSNITLGDAIKAASNLKAELKWSNEKQTRRMYSEQTDDQLLYSVASIIQRDIDKNLPTVGAFSDKLQLWDYNKNNDVDRIWLSPYFLSRHVIEFPMEIKVNELKISFWTGYNCLLSKKGADVTVVAYPAVLDSKPNDMAAVYTAMKKCLDMSNDAGQDYAIQTFDQQLCAIAKQVKWPKPDIFNRHILRLGGFYSLSCFFASIGKLCADGGLRDLLVDSGVYAGHTAELILNSKEFNRTFRGFTLVFEALQVLFISVFIQWVPLITSIRYHLRSGMCC
ncbi:unnamed protein product [Mytilus edulis]|uniref:Uncharacterized protein n=1 Tax=Mytilus edulis TaxID=6550 RepID=A0A8S3VCE2_MYTED|nr:unnamed protein product [Mytilus edulis]